MIWISLTACLHPDEPIDPADTEEVVFEIPRGATAQGLGPRLVEAGFVRSEFEWRWFLWTRGAGACLKAGRFRLSRSMNLPRILQTLCGTPLPEEVPFTVVEGWRIRDIDAALAELGLVQPGQYAAAASDPSRFTLPFAIEGLVSLEGFLFPETYMVPEKGFDAEAFIQRQIDTFHERFSSTHEVGARGLYATVILASMLEREEPSPRNRPLVAGIILKRLDKGWNLGIDATSRYTLPDWNDRDAFLAQLRNPDDPYNTRLRPGLPPTPIGNPGLSSLEAAIAPEPSEFWYYLHDSQGNLHPSRNVSEHEAYRRKYNVY